MVEKINKVREELLPYGFLEFHLFDLNDVIIYSNYRSSFWNYDGSEISLNLYESVKESGLRGGKYKLKLRHLSNVVGTIQNPLYIEEISSSKKEIRVRPYFDNDEINASFLNFLLSIGNYQYYVDYDGRIKPIED